MDGKLATGAIVAFAFSLGAASAHAADGRIVFSGAVLAPTCANGHNMPHVPPPGPTLPPAAGHASGNACGAPATDRPAAYAYSTTPLSPSPALQRLLRLTRHASTRPQATLAAVATRTYR